MLSLLLPRRPLTLGLGLGLTSLFATTTPLFQRPAPIFLDSFSNSAPLPPARVPVFKKGGGLNPDAVGQLSKGSILGM